MENLSHKKISHFQLLKQIGKGGMGIVYEAVDLNLDRTVAIKVLSPEAVGDEVALQRFLREARAAAKLNHPNITTIHDIQKVNHTIFIVMEYVSGETLAQIMDLRRLEQEEILSIALQITEGLQEAHRKNVIHRDVKPENIMISADGHVKIMDFGLAKVRGESRLTKDEFSMGTIDYIAPEQISHEHEVDCHSDIFSFGILLYEMVTGDLPFKGEHDWAVLYAILNNEPLPIDRTQTEIPPELERLIFKCLQKAPQDRFQSVNEISRELKKITKNFTPSLRATVKKSNKKVLFVLAGLMIGLMIAFFGIRFMLIKSPVKLNNQAVELYLRGEIRPATQLLYEVLRKDNGYSSAWSNLGMIYLAHQNYDSTIFCAQNAILYDSTNLSAYFILARALEKSEKLNEALSIYQQALQQDSTALSAYNGAALALINLGREDEAIELLKSGLLKNESAQQNGYIMKNLGLAYFRKKQFNEATNYLVRAAELDSTIEAVPQLLEQVRLEKNKMVQ